MDFKKPICSILALHSSYSIFCWFASRWCWIVTVNNLVLEHCWAIMCSNDIFCRLNVLSQIREVVWTVFGEEDMAFPQFHPYYLVFSLVWATPNTISRWLHGISIVYGPEREGTKFKQGPHLLIKHLPQASPQSSTALHHSNLSTIKQWALLCNKSCPEIFPWSFQNIIFNNCIRSIFLSPCIDEETESWGS